MSKKLLLPVLLVAAAIAVLIIWSQSTAVAGFEELRQGVSAGLLVLAALAVLRSFRDEAGSSPLAAWAVAVLLVAIAVAFFFSFIAGVAAVLAMFVLAAAVFGG
jgi:hypothetical protein